MSSIINVYAVDVARLGRAVGSRDAALIDAIVEAHADFLQSIDDIDEDAGMTCADAVAELINGEVSEEGPEYLYGYAVEALCAHLGEELPNICPISRASKWIEAVDRVLAGKGIPVRLATLVFGGSPVEIPEPDDAPSIGVWSAADVAAVAEAFRRVDLADLDGEMAETLAQVRGWAEAAAREPGRSVVGFLS